GRSACTGVRHVRPPHARPCVGDGADLRRSGHGDLDPVSMLWLQFFASALAVVVAGVGLVRCSDVIAEKGPLGRMWVGAVLLAGATSLPEVATSISAGWMGFPDIAVGNVYGSNTFNIFILAVADLLEGRGSILRKVSPGHILSAVFGM